MTVSELPLLAAVPLPLIKSLATSFVGGGPPGTPTEGFFDRGEGGFGVFAVGVGVVGVVGVAAGAEAVVPPADGAG